MRMRNKPWVKPTLLQCTYFCDHPFALQGAWQSCFAQTQPLQLELGCGKGVFTAQMAYRYPACNFLAIDLKSVVLASAVKNIDRTFLQHQRQPNNVVLVAYDIERIRNIIDYRSRVERIYINYCNPWPKHKHHKKRLVHTKQLLNYRCFLMDQGEIHFKTDDDALFSDSFCYFTQAGFSITYTSHDLYQSDYPEIIDTEHERKFTAQGIPIKFLIAKKQVPLL